MMARFAFFTIFLSWFAPIRLLPMPASQAKTITLTSVACFVTRSVMNHPLPSSPTPS